MRMALVTLIAALAMTAQADGIYKWVDENGVVHFGSQPPPKNKEVEVIRTPKSDRYKQWEAEQQALLATQKAAEQPVQANKQPAVKAEPEPRQQVDTSQAERAIRAQRCRRAQDNLQELTSHSRVRAVGPDGELRVLPEEERQERIAKARRTIRDNC
ncbi:DUF4124 domain-containing protein [Microbulbifer sp. 2201CG32-9]